MDLPLESVDVPAAAAAAGTSPRLPDNREEGSSTHENLFATFNALPDSKKKTAWEKMGMEVARIEKREETEQLEKERRECEKILKEYEEMIWEADGSIRSRRTASPFM